MPRIHAEAMQQQSANAGQDVQGRDAMRDLIAGSLRALAILACLILPAAAWAQATAGRSSSIVIPIAAKTGSFETEVWVRNANSASIDVDVLYYEANGLASPGLVACNFLTIAANSNVSFKLGTQCPSLATGSHFGLLVLRDRAAEKTNAFAAFSRVQHVTTNQGFSIEGFPEHVFSLRGAGIIGLKRKAAAVPPTTAQPGYQANCFVGSLGEPVDYAINLAEGFDSNIPIGSPITGSLGPYQLVRYVDILDAAGAPAGDKENVRVRFNLTSGAGAFFGFCTQQDNLSFGADFRIAKTDDEANITKLLLRCRGTSDPACATLASPALSLPNGTTKHRYSMFIHHPDYVRCDIVGPSAANLEIQLTAPVPAGASVGPVVAGGNNQSHFYYQTGPRGAVANAGGFQTFWNLEVSAREGTPPTFPVDYGLKCASGSGIHISGSGAAISPDDF
jgi:hypothetical protein